MGSSKPLQYHVFISHSSQDRNWADAVCKVLEARKMRCWIAPRNITPGTEWGEAIIDGIDQSRIIVLIFSANANESPQVRREVERAIGKAIPVLPLRIEDIQPKGAMEFALSNTHWLDAFTPPAADRLQQLADSVEALMGVKKPNSAASTTATPSTSGKRRAIWIGGAAVCLLALIASVTFYYSGSSETRIGTSNPSTAIDETLKYQGIWLAVEESRPEGPLLPVRVKARNLTLAIRDHNLILRRRATSNVAETLNGSITFEIVDGKNVFSVRGSDDEGTRHVWLGTYEFKDDHLLLCYRASSGEGTKPVRPRDIPLGPQQIFYKGERETYYLKLEKQGMPHRRH